MNMEYLKNVLVKYIETQVLLRAASNAGGNPALLAPFPFHRAAVFGLGSLRPALLALLAETGGGQDHEGLIPVFYTVLDFSQEEKSRLEAARGKMAGKWSLW
jgi:hypothetical protein